MTQKPCANLLTSGFYAWKRPAVRAVRRSLSSHPASCFDSHTVKVVAVEEDGESVVEVSIEDSTPEKKVAARKIDLRRYIREDTWLTTFLFDEARNPLCAVSQTQKEKSTEFLIISQYQYDGRFRIVASTASR